MLSVDVLEVLIEQVVPEWCEFFTNKEGEPDFREAFIDVILRDVLTGENLTVDATVRGPYVDKYLPAAATAAEA